jgi:hypothetical protein
MAGEVSETSFQRRQPINIFNSLVIEYIVGFWTNLQGLVTVASAFFEAGECPSRFKPVYKFFSNEILGLIVINLPMGMGASIVLHFDVLGERKIFLHHSDDLGFIRENLADAWTSKVQVKESILDA